MLTKQDLKNHKAMLYFGRELKPILGGEYKAIMTFEPNPGEKIYGMGQRQMDNLEMNGCELELAQRNSQASIPFYLSNKGYGFFWNNPALGEATFAKNLKRFTAEVTDKIDYWVTVGDTPAQIMEQYTALTGRPGEFPEWRLDSGSASSVIKRRKKRLRLPESISAAACRYPCWLSISLTGNGRGISSLTKKPSRIQRRWWTN